MKHTQLPRLFTARFPAWALGLFLCAASTHGAGVTVITHGFNSSIEAWILDLAASAPGHPAFRGASVSCYEIRIAQSGGQLVATPLFLGGAAPAEADSGEIFIKLDWSAVSNGDTPATPVAAAAAAALVSSNFIAALGGRALAELPLHLIGHSRGGPVISEMARLLGAEGVWVDQLTFLDPRPVGLFGDAGVTTYANVLFADNYWQMLGNGVTVPNGQSVFGAYNRKLLNLSGGGTSSHSDTHVWYRGTVDFTTPLVVDGATLGAAERDAWWTVFEAGGTNAGFHYSRIGRGNRLSEAEPAGAGNGRISDGFNRNWNLGAGLGANRAALPVNSGAWPNPIRLHLTGANRVSAGGAFSFALHHQSGAMASGTSALEVFLDPDGNPWNGNELPVSQATLANTGTGAVLMMAANAPTDPAAVAPGEYFIAARLRNGTRQRWLYAPELLEVSPSLMPPRFAEGSAPEGVSGPFAMTVLGNPGQTVVLQATTNLMHWSALATNILTGTSWRFTDADAPNHPRRFYRAMLVP